MNKEDLDKLKHEKGSYREKKQGQVGIQINCPRSQ